MKFLIGDNIVRSSYESVRSRDKELYGSMLITLLLVCFYPNMIANLIAEIQPLTSQSGEVITVKPRYTTTAAGVTAGQEVFVNQTDGGYASDEASENTGTGDNSTTVFGGTASLTPMKAGTVKLNAGGVLQATDNGNGIITGAGGSGTVNYETGVYSFTFTTAPVSGIAIVLNYRYDFELTPDGIREMDIGINLVPVQTLPHPLRILWSVASQLAASAQYNLDVEDTIATLGAQFIRKERDWRIVQIIANAATADSSLNFDTTVPGGGGLTRKQHFQDWSLKLAFADSLIINKNGRGNVSFVLAGRNASDVIQHQANFVGETRVVPIGSHKIGTLNGNIDVIKDPQLDPDLYVFGFRGMMTGDAALILAEWIPIFFTPVFQNSTLQNSQGLLSMYNTLLNNADYYFKGSLSNYSA